MEKQPRPRPAISGSITTLNEEHNITDCIRSLQRVCDEIIVVDSLSNDRTVEIAKSLGAKVIPQEYLGDGPQKNVSLAYVKNDWILSLDADERLDDEAVESIKALDLGASREPSYGFRKKNYIGSRWISCSGLYPDIRGRLYNRHRTRWDTALGHTRLVIRSTCLLEGHLLHYAYRDYSHYLEKIFKYSKRGAKMLYDQGKSSTPLKAAFHGFGSFIKNYLLRRGCVGGLDGLTVSLIAAVASYMKYAYLVEMVRAHQEAFDAPQEKCPEA